MFIPNAAWMMKYKMLLLWDTREETDSIKQRNRREIISIRIHRVVTLSDIVREKRIEMI